MSVGELGAAANRGDEGDLVAVAELVVLGSVLAVHRPGERHPLDDVGEPGLIAERRKRVARRRALGELELHRIAPGALTQDREQADPNHHSPYASRVGRQLSHLDRGGAARMVDVGDKAQSDRRARASARVRMSPETAAAVERGDAPKGDVVTVARIAGIQAAKRASELVPLAHPLPLAHADVRITLDAPAGVVEIEAEARTTASTGVEIEAITAASIAAVTVYDMVKGMERGVTIEQVQLLEKSGGKQDWRREDAADSSG